MQKIFQILIKLLIILTPAILILGFFGVALRVDLDLFPPKLPASIEEIKDWSEAEVYALYRNTLNCRERPKYKPDEPIIVSEWRTTCNYVGDIWIGKMDHEKVEKSIENARKALNKNVK